MDKIKIILALLCAAALQAQTGFYTASQYAYGTSPNVPALTINTPNPATGSQTVVLTNGVLALSNGQMFSPLNTNAPIIVGQGATQETVTPSSLVCPTPGTYATCGIVANWTKVHGAGETIRSATFGLQEAVNAASNAGGGIVVADAGWFALGGTTGIINAATVPGTVTVLNASTGSIPSTPTGAAGGSLGGNFPSPTVQQAVNAQTGTTYTVATGDQNKLVTLSNASAVAVTLPQCGSAGFAAGWQTDAQNLGAGAVTITPTTSTINGAATYALATGAGVHISCDGTNYQVQRGDSTFVQVGAAAKTRDMQSKARETAVSATDYTGAAAVNQANTAETQGLTASSAGVQRFPAGFGGGLDYFLNSSSLWSDQHCVEDYRGGSFSSIPGNDAAPWGMHCMRTTDPSAATLHESGVNFRTYWMGGGLNGNATKSVLENVENNLYVGGTSIGQHFGLGLFDTKTTLGDFTSIAAFTQYMGNCTEQGGECAESIRGQITNAPPMTGTVSTYNNSTGVLVPSTTTNGLNVGIGRLAIKSPAAPLYSTGTISGVSGTGAITLTGTGTSWSTLTTGAHTDLCFSPTDLDNTGQKWVLPITSITDDTHLVITYQVNNVSQHIPGLITTTGLYRIYSCSKVLSVAQPFGTFLAGFTVDTTTYNGWTNGDTFEVPQGYQYHAETFHGTLSATMPYSSGFPTSLMRLGIQTGYRPPAIGISFVGGVTRGLNFDTAPADDNNVSSTCIICVPSAAALYPLFRIMDGTNAVQLFVQPAATSGTQILHTPSTNTLGIGTTGAGNQWSVVTNTGVTTQNGTMSLASTADMRFTGGKGQHIRTQAAASDISGTLAISASTTASLTFTTAWTNAPSCTLTPISDPTSVGVWWVTTSTTTLTANVKTSGTITFNYICIGNPN